MPSYNGASYDTVTPLPTVNVDNITICEGDIGTLTATPNTAGGTYSWSPGGANSASIDVSPTSTTSYTVTYALGCPGVGTGTVTVNPAPFNSISSTYNNSCYFPLNFNPLLLQVPMWIASPGAF